MASSATATTSTLGGMSTWAVVKAQARDLLGIELTDYDAVNVPMIRADPYGNFIPGPNGFAQLVVGPGARRHPRDRRRHRRRRQPGGARSARWRSARCAPATCSSPTSPTPPIRSARRACLLAPDADDVAGGDAGRRLLRRRAARRPLHGRRRPRQREHRPDRRPPHLPLRAQSPGRAHEERDPR